MKEELLFVVMCRHEDELRPVFASFSIAAQVANQLRLEPLHSHQLQLSPHGHCKEKDDDVPWRGAVMNWTWLR